MTRRFVLGTLAMCLFTVPMGGVSARAAQTPAERIETILRDLRPRTGGVPGAPRTLQQEMAARQVPAVSIAVIDGGRIVWARAYGLADVAARRKATTATLFQAASISKPVAAMAALRLAERGTVDLDRDVNAYLAGWKIPYGDKAAGKVVTLRALLAHDSGLNAFWFKGYDGAGPVPSELQILNGEAPANSPAVMVEAQPGTAYRYTGAGYVVAQKLMSDVTGQGFPALMRGLVLGPAKMTSSTYEQPLPAALRIRAATGYWSDGKQIPNRFRVYPEQAAAGLWTTPSDLAHWVIAVQQAYAGRPASLIGQAMAKDFLTPGLGNWGIGIEIEGTGDGERFTHGGSNLGFKALMVGYKTGGRGYAIMTNGENGGPIALALSSAIARAYGWPEPPQKAPAAK